MVLHSHLGAVKKDGQLACAFPQMFAYDTAPSKPSLVGRGVVDVSTHALNALLL